MSKYEIGEHKYSIYIITNSVNSNLYLFLLLGLLYVIEKDVYNILITKDSFANNLHSMYYVAFFSSTYVCMCVFMHKERYGRTNIKVLTEIFSE